MLRNLGAVAAICLFCLACGNSPTDNGGNQAATDPGPFIAPSANVSLLRGDTIAVKWTNKIGSVELSYNMNDTNGRNYGDSSWHLFPDSQVVSKGQDTAMVYITQLSQYFQIRVSDTASGKVSQSGRFPVDDIVLLRPAGGESYAVGDTVRISFRRNPFAGRIMLHFVVDTGTAIGVNLNSMASIAFYGKPTSTFDTTWVIGQEMWGLYPTEYPGDSCRIYAFKYELGTQFRGSRQNPGIGADHNFRPFSIAARSTPSATGATRTAIR